MTRDRAGTGHKTCGHGARDQSPLGVIRAVYASEFIAVTMPPVDVAVMAPFASTSTSTEQSAPPAAQLNAISP